MRKVLALLLSVVMALSLMVTTAWADPVEQDLEVQVKWKW